MYFSNYYIILKNHLFDCLFWISWFVLIQIVSLTSGEMKWLANHLGHDVNILENVYRLQDSTVELAKISRLMMAVDTGQVAQFAGKSLSDIDISGNLEYLN